MIYSPPSQKGTLAHPYPEDEMLRRHEWRIETRKGSVTKWRKGKAVLTHQQALAVVRKQIADTETEEKK